MSHHVTFTPEAEEQLIALSHYIAAASSSTVAVRYIENIVSFCESFSTFPHRGNARDDIRPGLRVTHYRKRVVIAFCVEDDVVSILGVFYGGQNYSALLQNDNDDALMS